MKRNILALLIIILLVSIPLYSQSADSTKVIKPAPLPTIENPLKATVDSLSFENKVIRKLLLKSLFSDGKSQEDIIIDMYLENNMAKDQLKNLQSQITAFINKLKTAKDEEEIMQFLRDSKIRK